MFAFLKPVRMFLNRHINGTRGVISLFLALIMLPFCSIALLLTESARYQETAELVDEILDSAGFSTIADYDDYLENRFDLLAMSQESDPVSALNGYAADNLKSIGNSFTLSSSSGDAMYPLSEDGVLREEIMEYGEVTVLAEVMHDGLDIDELLDELYEKLELEDINDQIDTVTKTAEVADETAKLVTAVKDCLEEYEKYNSQRTEYRSAVSDFQTKAKGLIDALENAQEEGEENLYSRQTVKDAVRDTEEARDTLKKEAEEMSSSVTDMRKAVDDLVSAASGIADKTHDVKKAYEKAHGTTLADDVTTTTGEWVIQIADSITNAVDTLVSTTYSEDMLEQSRQLDDQKRAVAKVVCNRENDGTPDTYFIDVNATSDQVNRDFSAVSMDSVSAEFASTLNDNLEDLDSKNAGMTEDQKGTLGSLMDTVLELLDLDFVYDGALDANVSAASFYSYSSGDVAASTMVIIASIKTVVEAGQDFVDGVTSGDILKILKNLAKFLLGVVEFLAAIVVWATETLINIARLVSSGSQIYEDLLLAGYGVYNMPCRTTYDSGKTLSGYKYNKAFEMMGGTTGNKFSGAMNDLDVLLEDSGSGGAPGFKGAEAEYLLIGDANEIRNQSAAFFNVYLLRMLLDLYPILTNTQVKAMAAEFSAGSWVVYLGLILAEPFVDTFILVNGGTTYLVKDQVYLTPGGIILLAETLPSLTGLSDSSQDAIEDYLVTHNGKAKPSGKFKMNYQEHMLVLLLLSVDQTTLLQRYKNLIQMEAAQYHQDSGGFSLDQANTYIRATADGTLNAMFRIDALSNGSGFPMSRTRYIGY